MGASPSYLCLIFETTSVSIACSVLRRTTTLRMKVCGLVCSKGAHQSTSVSSDAVSLYYLNSGIDLGACTTWSRDCVISGATAFSAACQLCAGPPHRGVSHDHLQSLSLVLANRKGLGILCPRGHKGHMSAVLCIYLGTSVHPGCKILRCDGLRGKEAVYS